jgi:hypothetical protein
MAICDVTITWNDNETVFVLEAVLLLELCMWTWLMWWEKYLDCKNLVDEGRNLWRRKSELRHSITNTNSIMA